MRSRKATLIPAGEQKWSLSRESGQGVHDQAQPSKGKGISPQGDAFLLGRDASMRPTKLQGKNPFTYPEGSRDEDGDYPRCADASHSLHPSVSREIGGRTKEQDHSFRTVFGSVPLGDRVGPQGIPS